MTTRLKIAFLTGLTLVAGAAFAGPKAKLLLVATIVNSGSTNASGYQIDVFSNRTVSCKPLKLQRPIMTIATTDKLPSKMLIKLMHDLNTAMPLSNLSVRHGLRSASFGSRTYIIYKGQRSPDLTFGGNAQARALQDDIAAILKLERHGNSEPLYALPPVNVPVQGR